LVKSNEDVVWQTNTNGQFQSAASIAARFHLKEAFLPPAKSTIKAWTFFQEKFGRPAGVKLVALAGVEQVGNAGLSIN
jgi:hypothetical protein